MNIYVSNLSFNVADEDLRDFFAEYGEITSAKIIMDRATGRSRGFGFVEMPNDEEAKKAIQELDGGVVEGRTISVTVAKPREERPSNNNNRRSFSNNGGSGGGYNNRY